MHKGRFDVSLAAVLRWEGGISDHKADRGGLTRLGISLRFLRMIGFDVNGDGVVDGQDIRALKPDQVRQLYLEHFWRPCRCSVLPPGLDMAVFDCAVNQGTRRARVLLQKALGVQPDGIIGSKTLFAAEKMAPELVLGDFMARRALHYSGLRNLSVFGLGWFRRLFDIHRRSLDGS